MNRREFIKTGGSAAALLLAPRAWAAEYSGSKQSNEDILSQCAARIEKGRKGDGVIFVKNASGKAIAGVRLKIEQVRHDFLFGCNCFLFGRSGKPEFEEAYRERFSAIFNYSTLGFYWNSYEPMQGKPNYAYTEQVAEWTRNHGITCKGHPLVWDHPASSPRWLPGDLKEIQRLSDARVKDIVSHFKGRIDIWDVVNEPTHLADKFNKTKMAEFGASVGAIAYTSQPLNIAREVNPKAILLVNDYRTDPAYYRILSSLKKDEKYLFDTVGIQSHMHDRLWSARKVWEVCDTFAKLGQPLHFTETTILSGPRNGPGENWGATTAEGEAKQAEQTVNFYMTLFAHSSVQAITWWDFSDHGAWQRAPAGWLRSDMSPKPVYERVMGLIKGQWWTNVDGITNARGEFKTRAYFGKHRLTAELPNGKTITKEVHWQRGNENRFELMV